MKEKITDFVTALGHLLLFYFHCAKYTSCRVLRPICLGISILTHPLICFRLLNVGVAFFERCWSYLLCFEVRYSGKNNSVAYWRLSSFLEADRFRNQWGNKGLKMEDRLANNASTFKQILPGSRPSQFRNVYLKINQQVFNNDALTTDVANFNLSSLSNQQQQIKILNC